MTAIPRLRAYSGPTLLSYGFRPFFFFGAVYAGLAILIWMPFYLGEIKLATSFSPRDWHAHEMIYGYLPAIITGFLLTAIPNWTGRMPLQGGPLAVLVITWAVGRTAVAVSAQVGWLAATMLDGGFLFLLAGAAGREVIYGRNWSNLKVLMPVVLLGLGNIAFHIEAHFGSADYGVRVGVAAVIVLLMLIGGRIIPSFTGNWLRRQGAGRMPHSFGRFDAAVVLVSAAALIVWIVWPFGMMTAVSLSCAGLLQIARLARWAGDRTMRDRLVLVLHVAYAFVPLGFLLTALGSAQLITTSAGIHAWMTGAAGIMTLGVMSRATLGHTGQPLTASVATQGLYLCVFVAAMARICAAIEPQWQVALLCLAAIAWTLGFLGFAILFAPLLWQKRRVSA
jgi:uncharacterized protein involved in response to NO